jgi:hypothetical protein
LVAAGTEKILLLASSPAFGEEDFSQFSIYREDPPSVHQIPARRLFFIIIPLIPMIFIQLAHHLFSIIATVEWIFRGYFLVE